MLRFMTKHTQFLYALPYSAVMDHQSQSVYKIPAACWDLGVTNINAVERALSGLIVHKTQTPLPVTVKSVV